MTKSSLRSKTALDTFIKIKNVNRTYIGAVRSRFVVRRKRGGLTLLEIVLSLAIFFGGVTALSQLAWNGSRAAMQARYKTQATIRCQAKLSEVLAGAEAMQSQSGIPFLDDSNWTWSEVVTSGGFPNLVQIDITVSHQGPTKMSNVSVTLRRWTRPLTLFAQAAAQQKTEADEKVKPQ